APPGGSVGRSPKRQSLVEMPIYRSDVVGSLLRPAYLVEARRGAESGRLGPAEFKRLEDRAVDEAIDLQEAAGLAVVTDGEMRRYAFFGHLIEALDGFDKLGGWAIPNGSSTPASRWTTPSSATIPASPSVSISAAATISRCSTRAAATSPSASECSGARGSSASSSSTTTSVREASSRSARCPTIG